MLKFRMILAIASLIGLYSQAVYSDFIFTAPPRESLEKGIKVYKPIADYLSGLTGERFVYEHPETWAEYSTNMHAEKYDLVFDGPHFVDWRINNLGHNVLIKLPHIFRWQIIARKDDTSINDIQDIVGKKVCAPGSPNFGMLSMFSHFTNPEKQPQHVKIKGWINVFDGVKNGQCDAGVLPRTNLSVYDKDSKYVKIIHTHLPYPNQGFTAGNRISSELQQTIRQGLLSRDGQEALTNLRKRFAADAKLIRADNEEYDGVRIVLKRAENFTYKKESLVNN